MTIQLFSTWFIRGARERENNKDREYGECGYNRFYDRITESACCLDL